ncbi:Structural maintenance of chromosomes protein 3 [Malassezia pachydermatis]
MLGLENERRREVDASHTRQAAYTRQAHEVAAMEAQARALEEQLEQLAWDQAQLEQERRALTRSQAHLDNTRDDVAMAMDGQGPEALTEQLAALDAEVLAREQALATKTQEHTHAAATLEAQRTAYEDTRARLAALYAKQGRAAHYDTVEARDEAIQAELDEVARQLAQQDTAMATAKAQWEAAQAQHAEHAAHMRDVEQTYAQRTQAYHDAQAAWDTRHAARAKYVEEKNEQWNADAKRTTQLTQARDELSQAQRALAATMDRATAAGLQAVERIAAAEHLDGVLGPLYQLFHVDERYRLAVEATAGAALFHVVVDTDTTATRLLQRLQQEKSGRVTFMPLNRLRPVDTPMPQAPDAVVLLRKLTFDDALLPAMKQVFGKTIVCPRLEIAAAYVRSHRGLNAITLDGDQVDRRGALSGGYHDPSRSRLDAVQRVQQALTRVDTLASEQAAARQALATLEQTLTAVYSEMIALEAQKAQAQDARTQAQNELTYLRRTEADAAARVARCERACTEATLARQTLSTRQAALQAELGTPLLHHLSQEEQADVQRLTAQTRAQQSALATQTRTTVALAEQLATLQSELDEHWRRSRASVQDRLERARPAPSAEAAAALAQSRATNADRLAHLQAQQDTLSATYARLQADLATARASHEHEADVTQQQAAAERWAARKQRMLEQRARCHERIRDLGALPDDAFQTYQRQTTEALVTQLQTTRTSLDALSHVNKRAVEQLDSFTQQRTALLQRHADLQASQASIHELIDVLDQRKDAALTSTYEQVAMHFRTIFAQLVPTGQGTLQRHEHGVSLQVTFHTQQTQMRMAQLSGGQKSLVALALVCAMQKTDPAPFYLWDEIDANLDTQYRTAVANLVHALAADAQFITTTFRPELVERADRHFGVVFRPDKTSTVLDISRADAQDFVEAADT